ncbi:sodium/proton antiporter, NhaA family [Pseudorhodobacter antarcticus]|uniref:Putative Na(+)/H(+) antiporter NhaA homolog n=1 Tax=Pseudorhodobacter antarcticus TaxID=1077947 RepID=A0A1H8KWQ7_9RHOB|nr:Na+/H+ antiporter NhaA [Pseudorhodobacter antarcticus]SEN97313.1 sodium/proton antiporter, NhaA family [Pseudorhodobacter antarcticus]
MTPASPYLSRYAYALLIGAAIATLAVTFAPSTYYDAIEWLPFDSDPLHRLRLFYPGFTFASVVSSLLMPVFVLLIAKEIWEAVVLEHGGLHGKLAVAPLAMVAGAMLAGAVVWQGLTVWLETAEEAVDATGWVMPFGSDMVLAFLFGRMIFGKAHPALQVLLFLCILDGVIGLIISGFATPIEDNLRALWLIVPLAAASFGYVKLTRPLQNQSMTERKRQRTGRLWPWVVLGVLSWIGVSASGLPPALGLLPLLPAMPHGTRSFGLFAEAEGFLTDPLNRLSHMLMGPVIVILFLFGVTRGGVDFAAFGPTTVVAVGAFWLGKPLGLLAVVMVLRAVGRDLPNRLDLRDMCYVAGLMGIGFTLPLLSLETALPGGAMQEAARLGLALTLLAGPVLIFVARKLPPKPRMGGKRARN